MLTGAKFGTINSSIWFNLLTARALLVLALGMFDVINIDLSRFSAGFGSNPAAARTGGIVRIVIIFTMGAMAAVLAGACVAPVVISAMALADVETRWRGNFVLDSAAAVPAGDGHGVAVAAGRPSCISPKPGKWMNRVKHGFGVLIVLFSVYYLHLSYNAYVSKCGPRLPLAAAAPGGGTALQNDSSSAEFAEALRQARLQGRPVLLGFHASWCKNCLAMDETVFKREEVKKHVHDFIVVRYDAERPGKSPTREVLDHFGVIGLPTYVVLTCTK